MLVATASSVCCRLPGMPVAGSGSSRHPSCGRDPSLAPAACPHGGWTTRARPDLVAWLAPKTDNTGRGQTRGRQLADRRRDIERASSPMAGPSLPRRVTRGLSTRELDVGRRADWAACAPLPTRATAMGATGACWARLKRPEDLTRPSAQRRGGAQARRGRTKARLPARAAAGPLVRLSANRAYPSGSSSAPAPFAHRDGMPILTDVRLGLTNARVEGTEQTACGSLRTRIATLRARDHLGRLPVLPSRVTKRGLTNR